MSRLPLRQKLLFALAIIVGLFIACAIIFEFLEHKTLGNIIVIYSIGLPLFILVEDTLVDLNDIFIWSIWMLLGIIFLIFFFLFESNLIKLPQLRILKNQLAIYPVRLLLILPVFLITYWILNLMIRKITGNFLINTFRQRNWYHISANRKIEWYDIVCNIVLYVVIFSMLFNN